MDFEQYAAFEQPTIAIDPDFVIRYVNPAWERLTGFAAGEAVGLAPPYPWWTEQTPVNPREDLEDAIAKGRWQAENRLRTKTGGIIWVQIMPRVVAETDGTTRYIISHWQEITEKKRAEEELLAKAREMQILLDTAEGRVWYLHDTEHYGIVNRKYAEFLGMTPEEIRGKSIWELYPYEQAKNCVEGSRHVMTTGCSLTRDEWVTDRQGRKRAFSVSKTPGFGRDGRVAFLACSAVEVTEERESVNRELRRREAALRDMANRDQLTGLPNRRYFNRMLKEAFCGTEACGCCHACFLADIGKVQSINIALGQSASETLLKEVARRLGGVVRAADILARSEGSSFLLLARDLRGPEDARELGERLSAAVIYRPFFLEERTIYLTVHVGYSLFPGAAATPEELQRQVESALATAQKTGGSPPVHRYSPQDDTIPFRFSLEQELRQALEQGQFRLHYQPHLDLGSRETVGAEALLRWAHPTRGLVPPGEFIPVLEESNLIRDVGLWVLQSACSRIRQWRNRRDDVPPVSINTSVEELYDPHFLSGLEYALSVYEVPPQCLGLEITETIAIHDLETVQGLLGRISEMGVTILLDDFGTGYSSLNVLHRLPVDIVKIDQSFVSALETDSASRTLVQTILAMCRQLGHRTLAEGIETEAQLALLRDYGCEMGQGFLFSRPVPPEQLFQPAP